MSSETNLTNLSLLELFNMEVKTQVALLNNNLLALENKPEPTEELTALMRAAHSIKGAAKIVQVDAAVSLAHVMEDYFVAVQEGTITLNAADVDVLLQAVDILLQIADDCVNQPEVQFAEDERITSLVKAIAENARMRSACRVKTQMPSNLGNEEVGNEDMWTRGQKKLEFPIPPSPPLSQSPAPEQPTITQNRVVRVGADNLNRLMGLAGESLVEAKWLEPFADSLLELKHRQTDLFSLLENLQDLLRNSHLDRHIQEQLSVAHQTANECRQILSDRHNELEIFSQRSANLAERLYRQAIATHMRPFADAGWEFPRLVRDLARQLGKRVNLEIVGKSTLVDRDILERLKAPLTHILRNAIDHGIESPQERLAAGKAEAGNICLEVTHRAGMLLITVTDDGRGIDLEFLRQEVVRKQLTHRDMATHLTEAELMQFLFLPGFSTATAVTEISGRGVGLDVAYSTLREIGGSLRAVSKPGQGMTFSLQLPLTLSVIRTLLAEISGEPYAFGLSRIERVVMLSKSDIFLSENQHFFILDDCPVLLISGHQVLDLPSPVENLELLPVIVISDRSSSHSPTRGDTQLQEANPNFRVDMNNHPSHYGLIVDKFLGECSLVVRPLDPRLGKVPNISAAALMEDGSPLLIVDVEDLVGSIAKVLASGQISQLNQSTQQNANKTYKHVLVVDDSITVREMERKLLENNGYQVDVAVNGMDGWNAVCSGNYNLVITDIDMPRMNGFQLTSHMKTHSELKHIPVIIVSYKDREEDRLQGLKAGADYYLTKSSFHDDTLMEAVIDLVGEA
ncbi:hybrid sensor histidine kinase/response regulator [Mastigocoleus sp. MO_188.B34]|uniref:hybrid sensor histidine kinase/response regulator n=1 Tax=Mastigocoleus sp. MO_188.B34 TaxID=3036635 RepID=UPI00261F00B8|nr:hybrid sensor histidine kinase/response regulator [Mastigocoleus sp. MO_188.B34]MDJ0697511.1 hybrid sensor histidine kinase/response regulator [Mastigocoleus sp. MO_188.B34]